MMDELLMRMGMRRSSEKGGLWKELFQFMAVKAKKKQKTKNILFIRGKSYKEEPRTQENKFMPRSLK